MKSTKKFSYLTQESAFLSICTEIQTILIYYLVIFLTKYRCFLYRFFCMPFPVQHSVDFLSDSSVLHDLRKECFAPFPHIPVGRIKITRVPWVGNVLPCPAGKIQKPAYLALRIAISDDPVDIADIPRIHADQIVKLLVLLPSHLAGAVVSTWDADLAQLSLGARMNRIADLLSAGGSGINVKPVRKSRLGHQVFHNVFRHCTTTNIAMANEKYFYHV